MAPDTFHTQRLTAERLVPAHAPEMHRMHQDPVLMAPLGGLRDEAASAAYMERNLAHWARHGFGIWVLRAHGAPGVVGRAGLRHLAVEGRDEVELSYALIPTWWGRGLATEIAGALVTCARATLGLPSLVALTTPANLRSQGVMTKVGLRFEREVPHAGAPHLLFRRVLDPD